MRRAVDILPRTLQLETSATSAGELDVLNRSSASSPASHNARTSSERVRQETIAARWHKPFASCAQNTSPATATSTGCGGSGRPGPRRLASLRAGSDSRRCSSEQARSARAAGCGSAPSAHRPGLLFRRRARFQRRGRSRNCRSSMRCWTRWRPGSRERTSNSTRASESLVTSYPARMGAGAELTPTMKLRRRSIGARYGDLIDSLYSAGTLFRVTLLGPRRGRAGRVPATAGFTVPCRSWRSEPVRTNARTGWAPLVAVRFHSLGTWGTDFAGRLRLTQFAAARSGGLLIPRS